MVFSSYIIITTLILTLVYITKINTQDCPKYTCSSFTESKMCARATPVLTQSNNLSYFNVSVLNCGQGYTCPLSLTTLPYNTTSSIYCVASIAYPLVDGEKCSNNSDCGSNRCDNKICIGKPLNAACNSTVECATSFFCDTKRNLCAPQKNMTESCSFEDECSNEGGCLNGKCTKYWSLPSYSNISSPALAEWYCQSGFSYKGYCMTPINIDSLPFACDSLCKYQFDEDNSYVDIPELCTCGYNSLGNKYCQHGSNSTLFLKYKEMSLNLLDNNCHVSKKFSCTDKLNYMDTVVWKNFYLAWKGKLQLTDSCLTTFFSSSGYIYNNLFVYMLLLMFYFI
jgi:hypothetical protein